jgi:hypothetical protein
MNDMLRENINHKKKQKTGKTLNLYFHSRCFDGVVSAALVTDCLRDYNDYNYFPVNYHLKNEWLSTTLESPSCIVDFLYHHNADLFWDHHDTTFLHNDVEKDYNKRTGRYIKWDPTKESCAELIFETFNKPAKHDRIVKWAHIIDGARYKDPDEAVNGFSNHNEMKIALLLSEADDNIQILIIELLRENAEGNLEEILNIKPIKNLFDKVFTKYRTGLERILKSVKSIDDIAEFEVEENSETIIPRYAAFLRAPKARYSLGLIRRKNSAKITMMRNPWIEFESVNLGKLSEQFGGGGHHRVGSIVIPNGSYAKIRNIKDTIHKQLSESVYAI